MEDHPMMRAAMARNLELEGGFEVVGEAGAADGVPALAQKTGPDLVILDLSLKGAGDGVELCREIKALPRPPRVLVHSAYNAPETVAACRAAGADGFLHKREDPSWFAKVAREVAAGKRIWMEGGEVEVPEPSLRTGENPSRLTPREREVHDLILRGYTNPQIARELCITKRTVKSHAGSVYEKLGVKGREDLLRRP